MKNESLKLRDGAAAVLRNELTSKSTYAMYKSLVESAENSYQTRFASDFQTYVTRLGLIIDKIAADRRFRGKNTYRDILWYICKDILCDDSLRDNLMKVNSRANAVKHTTRDVSIDIGECLAHYNSMIDRLASASACDVFNMCHVYTHGKNSLKSDDWRGLLIGIGGILGGVAIAAAGLALGRRSEK